MRMGILWQQRLSSSYNQAIAHRIIPFRASLRTRRQTRFTQG